MQLLLDNLAQHLQSNHSYEAVLQATCAVLEYIKKFPHKISLAHHPLGFFLIKLGEVGSSTSLRLHIWLPNKRTVQNPAWFIHNHIFTLKSYVLAGEITNILFNTNFVATQANKCLYRVAYNSDSSILNRTSHYLSCNKISEFTYWQGEHYVVEKGQYHATYVPSESLTVTVVLASNRDKINPYVIGDLQGENRYIYCRTAMHSLNIADVASFLLDTFSLR
ncbi:MAG: hypothetical protein HC836_38245 [Richelia sp. RM2_1_2]|nr:hypothetical protein [Richelia sp. RM1_1_1]NJO63820.1 hypothetical protein [Richelia sp. RM2_1_2]